MEWKWVLDNPEWVINIVVILFFAFFLQYVKKKSENLATKEDIGKITEIVEGVKADISLQTSHAQSTAKETRDCLLDFYDVVATLAHGEIQINFRTGLPDFSSQPKWLYELERELSDLFVELEKKYYRLYLYFEPTDKLIVEANQISIAAETLRKTISQEFPSVCS